MLFYACLSAICMFSVECVFMSFAHLITGFIFFTVKFWELFIYSSTLLSNARWGFLSFENHYHKYRHFQGVPEVKRMNGQCGEGGLISRNVHLCGQSGLVKNPTTQSH